MRLETRLRRKGFTAARIRPCLDALEGQGLLDDGAVAAALVRDRLRHRPRGRSALVSELRSKGIDAELASEAIERVYGDEDVTDASLAKEAAESWLARQGTATLEALASSGHAPERDKARRRVYGYLARRGFRGDALTDALEHAVRRAREDSEPG
jgi:regulatory protein